MATINVPEDLVAGLRAKAEAEGKTLEELAEETLRASLKETSWEDLLEYGRDRGRIAARGVRIHGSRRSAPGNEAQAIAGEALAGRSIPIACAPLLPACRS